MLREASAATQGSDSSYTVRRGAGAQILRLIDAVFLRKMAGESAE
jgi:hypothetical protein